MMKSSSTATQKTVFGSPLFTTRPLIHRPRSTSQITCKAGDSKEISSNLSNTFALSTSLLVASVAPVEAVEEVAQLAAQDNRLGAVAFIFVPAIAWVLFNILGPASRQLEKMNEGKPKPVTPKSTGRAAPAKKKPVATSKPAPKRVPPKKAPVKKAPVKKAPAQKAPAKKGFSFFGKK
eukprot:g6718.t1